LFVILRKKVALIIFKVKVKVKVKERVT